MARALPAPGRRASPGAGARESHPGGPDWAVLEVRDQGLGIPTDDRARIFDGFHRGANVVGRIPGAGIGLAASLQVVEGHGGRIAVESEEGRGSTFTVWLPLTAPEPRGAAERAAGAAPVPGGTP